LPVRIDTNSSVTNALKPQDNNETGFFKQEYRGETPPKAIVEGPKQEALTEKPLLSSSSSHSLESSDDKNWLQDIK
jgi:hypothetical protein